MNSTFTRRPHSVSLHPRNCRAQHPPLGLTPVRDALNELPHLWLIAILSVVVFTTVSFGLAMTFRADAAPVVTSAVVSPDSW
jgi:hypothetical protein